MNPDALPSAATPSLVRTLLVFLATTGSAALGNDVDFSRDVRPILSDACFKCHGPDEAKRKAKLRLDTRHGAFSGRDGRIAVAPGDPEGSELIRRITSTDPDERMPPRNEPRQLSAAEIETIRRWIAADAKWEQHWSFVAPRRPPLPTIKRPQQARNEIDPFIVARLDREGLSLSPAAARSEVLRRASLDLTGLPPTPAELDRFIADARPDAYERAIDRLLSSPRFGERLASHWLDAARYADTNGYQTDGERSMWRWRDWVISAWNAGKPFDEFTVEQLAGDLLPAPDLDQLIATGFNRNHRGNGEGGIVDAEYLVEYVVDRVDTTSTVWLGLTMGCARCHDHKYDPVSQRDFYRVFAYFNNVPERGRAFKFGNSPPWIAAPTAEQQEARTQLAGELERARQRVEASRADRRAAQARWERTAAKSDRAPWNVGDGEAGLLLHLDFEGALRDRTALGRAVWSRGGEAAFAAGRVGQALELSGRNHVEPADVEDLGYFSQFTIAAWIRAESGTGPIVTRMSDPAVAAGYEVVLEDGHVHVHLVKRWLDDALRVRSRGQVEPGRWHHLAVTYDGSRFAKGIEIRIDGDRWDTETLLDEINQDFVNEEPVRIGARGNGDGFRGLIDEVRVYARRLDEAELRILATPESPAAIAAVPANDRSAGAKLKLERFYIERRAPDHLRREHSTLENLRRRLDELEATFPRTMIMRERAEPRPTHVLVRGQYDRPGVRVTAGIPAFLPPLRSAARNDRLALARWLVDGSNPLTARVTVNRFWQMLFGRGLVETVEDFGAQGARPSHPELLDWLATELVRNGWDVKSLLRTIVTSATYRQSSRATARRLAYDPKNVLLARATRLRLSAEMIRDQALAASGLLVERLGGPSVRPYQPEGLWKELSGQEYVPDSGASLFRRSLYTLRKRTCGPPAMMAFDASAREACAVRETRTNTPLQALTLMNDVTFVEASRSLATRMLREGGRTDSDRLRFGFRLLTARFPTPVETDILLGGLAHHRASYARDLEGATKLVGVGDSLPDASLDAKELAAWTAVANLLLNLDEAINRG